MYCLFSVEKMRKKYRGNSRKTPLLAVTAFEMHNFFQDYGNRVDPVSALGLDSGGCLLCYRVEGVVCGPSLPRPELLPCGYCVGSVDSLHVWLKVVDPLLCFEDTCFTFMKNRIVL